MAGIQGHIDPGVPPDFDIIDLSSTDATPNTAKGAYWRGISFAVDGAIKVDTLSTAAKVIPASSLSPQIQHSMGIKKIWKVGTTATGIIAWY